VLPKYLVLRQNFISDSYVPLSCIYKVLMLMPLKLEKIIKLTSFFQKIDLLTVQLSEIEHLVNTNSLMIDGGKA
jgi:hypothetical protein